MGKDIATGHQTTIYNAKEALSELKTPVVMDPEVKYFPYPNFPF